MPNIHLRRLADMTFTEFCKRLDKGKSTADKLEIAYKKKQREKKIKKLLAFDSHWRGLS